MAVSQGARIVISVPAAADLSGAQYRFVNIDADGRGTIAAGPGAQITGILQNKPDAQGHAAEIVISGESKLVSGASFNEGDALAAGVEGFGTTTTRDTEFVGALARIASAASGDIAEVIVNPHMFAG